MPAFQIKRIYDPPDPSDGARILVDRLWPRGVSKQRAALDGWLKEAAPSPGLREWFGHLPERFEQFGEKYRQELAGDPVHRQAVADLMERAAAGRVTLLYAAKSPTVNHAVVLKEYLESL